MLCIVGSAFFVLDGVDGNGEVGVGVGEVIEVDIRIGVDGFLLVFIG